MKRRRLQSESRAPFGAAARPSPASGAGLLAALLATGCGSDPVATVPNDLGATLDAASTPDAPDAAPTVPDAHDTPDTPDAFDAPPDAPPDTSTATDAAVDDLSDAPGDTPGDVPGDALPDVPPDLPGDVDAAVPIALRGPCTDSADQVYVTPPGLPAFGPDRRGDVVRCATDPAQNLAAVEANLRAANVEGVSAAWPVDVYRVAFRTMRNDVAEGLSSARVYLPHGATGPQTLVVVAHPSEGLAASCATSRNASSMRDLALPWAARGYPVIAPDYAGLGTAGTQGYLDNGDTARSLLDAARALRRLVAPGAVSPRIVLVGYSQGGGAVLAAQGLVRTYGADGDVAAAVVFAPEWPSRLNSFQLVSALGQPDALTISQGITTPVVVTLMAYSWYENHVGAGMGGLAFPAAIRAGTPGAITSLCLTPYGGYIQGVALHVRDWLDAPLRTGFLACVNGTASAGCTGAGRDFYQFVRQNSGTAAGGDPAGAPVFYVQGMADPIMPPAQEAACNLDRLHRDGVDVEVCTDDVAIHTNVVARNTRHAIAWAEARLAGRSLAGCTGPAMPACAP